MDSLDLAKLLASLSEEEQAIIRPVLERDLEFQRREKARIESMKSIANSPRNPSNSSLKVEEQNSSGHASCESFGSHQSLSRSLSPSSPSGRLCIECGGKLGLLFNAGTKCRKCGQMVCDSCKAVSLNNNVFCPKCHAQRELLAATGEWRGESEGDDPVSAALLRQMRRESESAVRSPRESMRARNMSLPTHTSNMLTVPMKPEYRQQAGDSEINKYWCSSPSPRVEKSPTLSIPGSNPSRPSSRETFGSPIPRPLEEESLELEEEEEEEEQEGDDTISTPPALPTQAAQRRQSWQHANKIRLGTRRQSEQIIPRIYI